MEVQECAKSGIELREMPRDPQSDMIRRQREFQKLVGRWDVRIKGRAPTFVRHDMSLHHIDMAVQEASEAWDLLEGGWKHHKRNPRPAPRDEVLMEIVDVLCFAYNAFLFMGGDEDAEIIAKQIAQSATIKIATPIMGLAEAWDKIDPEFTRAKAKLLALYGHGDGAHGEPWVKETAAYVNMARARLASLALTMRGMLARMSSAERAFDVFPAAAGFVYLEAVEPAYIMARSVPGCTPQELYSAFCAKNEINIARQQKGY